MRLNGVLDVDILVPIEGNTLAWTFNRLMLFASTNLVCSDKPRALI